MRPRPTPRPARVKVLVVLHADGLVEVYGDSHLDVHCVNRLFVEGERGDLSTAIDEYTTAAMPRCYRDLYWPNKLRAAGNVEKILPEQAHDTLYQLSILRALWAQRPAPAAISKVRRATT